MSEQLKALIRNVLMAVGTFLASLGYLKGLDLNLAVGTILTAIGFVWSWLHLGALINPVKPPQ